MSEARHRVLPAESLVEHIVERQGRKPFLSTDDLGDLHQVIVHDVGKMVGRQFIGPLPEHLVVEGVGVHFDVTSDQVIHLDNRVGRHLEAYGPVGSLLKQPLDLILREGQRVAHRHPCHLIVDKCLTCGFSLSAGLFQSLGGVESIVGVAVLDQLLGVLAVDSAPLALAVRSVRMTLGRCLDHLAVSVHAFVRNDAAPVKSLDDIFLGPGNEPVGVGVLDPDDEITSALLGIEVVIESRADSAHMQRTGR